MPKKRLYLIDANAFCYRVFFALRGLATSSGQPTNAIFGFVNFLNKIFKQEKPQYLAACFDVSRNTFRAQLFSEYKIQRPPMPQDLASQFPIIKEIIKAYGISIFEKEGFEADDLIATLTKKARAQDMEVMIISSDKDILQLVDEHVAVFSPYQDKGVLYDQEKIKERFGISPAQIIDFIALVGDPTDNIPGVKGLGPKTAVKLIQDYDSVKGILSNVDNIDSQNLRLNIKENLSLIDLSRRLALLREDVELDFIPDDLKIKAPDYLALHRIFRQLEFKKLLKELPAPQGNEVISTETNLRAAEIAEFLQGESELILIYQQALWLLDPQKEIFLKIEEEKFDTRLANILADPKIRKIGHDLKDLKIRLAKRNIKVEGLYFDTMLAAYLLNPGRSDYSLSGLALDYLGEVCPKETNHPQAFYSLLLRLKGLLEKELKEKDLIRLFFDLEMPLIEVLFEMESAGVKIDLGVLGQLSVHIEKELAGLVDKIFELSGAQFNINSPKQLREVLFERLKLPVVKKTKSGPSTDEEVLSALAEKHPLPKILLEYRKLTKIKSTYVDALPLLMDKEQKIHASFNQTGTQTGRLSCSNPNLQNLPIRTEVGSQIRKAIIASGPGIYLVSADYSQVELRILAHICKDEHLISAFREDRDIHKSTASLIYGLEEKDITQQMREVAKRVNFGIIYGLSAYGLARDLGIKQEEAQIFIDAYFSKYPRVREYIEGQILKAQKEGFVTTILGRRRYIPDINNKNQGIRQFAQRQAVNAPIQGSASDLIKLTMIEIHREIKSRNLPAKMILQIHDELVFEVLDGRMPALAELVKDKMEHVLELDVPVKVEIKKGRNWLEMEEVR